MFGAINRETTTKLLHRSPPPPSVNMAFRGIMAKVYHVEGFDYEENTFHFRGAVFPAALKTFDNGEKLFNRYRIEPATIFTSFLGLPNSPRYLTEDSKRFKPPTLRSIALNFINWDDAHPIQSLLFSPSFVLYYSLRMALRLPINIIKFVTEVPALAVKTVYAIKEKNLSNKFSNEIKLKDKLGFFDNVMNFTAGLIYSSARLFLSPLDTVSDIKQLYSVKTPDDSVVGIGLIYKAFPDMNKPGFLERSLIGFVNLFVSKNSVKQGNVADLSNSNKNAHHNSGAVSKKIRKRRKTATESSSRSVEPLHGDVNVPKENNAGSQERIFSVLNVKARGASSYSNPIDIDRPIKHENCEGSPESQFNMEVGNFNVNASKDEDPLNMNLDLNMDLGADDIHILRDLKNMYGSDDESYHSPCNGLYIKY